MNLIEKHQLALNLHKTISTCTYNVQLICVNILYQYTDSYAIYIVHVCYFLGRSSDTYGTGTPFPTGVYCRGKWRHEAETCSQN